MFSIKLFQCLRITLLGWVFFSSTLPATAYGLPTVLEKVAPVFRRVFHPFRTANHEFQRRELKMIAGKTLTLKGLIVGKGNALTGKVIEGFTASLYSHVTFILENKDKPTESFCYQSNVNLSNFLNFIWPQVNIVSYEALVSSYSGSLFRRDFIFDDEEGPTPAQVSKNVKDYLGRPYEQHLLEYLRSTTRSNKKENPSGIFCSELMALVLQDLNYLSKDIPADNYLPGDFAQGCDSFLKLRRVKLGNQFVIKS